MREFQRAAEKQRRKQLKKDARARVRERRPPSSRKRKESVAVYVREILPSGDLGEIQPLPGVVDATFNRSTATEMNRHLLAWSRALVAWYRALVARLFRV